MNFLTEHGIGSYEELVERCDAVAAASIRTRESLRDTEQRITNLALIGRQIDTYRKLKPIYDRYKASKDKEKFLRGFESEIILFETAAREIKKAGLTKLPSAEKLKAELNELTARKTALQAELRKIQREEKEFNLIQKNIGIILNVQKQKEKSEPELGVRSHLTLLLQQTQPQMIFILPNVKSINCQFIQQEWHPLYQNFLLIF